MYVRRAGCRPIEGQEVIFIGRGCVAGLRKRRFDVKRTGQRSFASYCLHFRSRSSVS